MEYLRHHDIADAGDNFLHIMLPKGSILNVVNAKNATTPWRVTSIYLARSNAADASADTISFRDSIIQPALKDVHWDGAVKISEGYRRVEAKFEGCTALDVIALTVGYEL